ncbi:MAG: ABC transporter substrate-binding protein, partial [Gemmatimonadetes bacterium]|nr:ABC transporter substrate-binding protein [Gemmatimonadota bacterium]
MSDLRLSIAMGDYDRTRPLADGRVKIDGGDPAVMLLTPEEMFFRAMRHRAFDICELSLSSYVISVARGDPHYIAVPVYLSRAFRHTSIYIRTDKRIEQPEDLRGR